MTWLFVGFSGIVGGLLLDRQRNASSSRVNICKGVREAIGNTPLIELPSLSQATGCRILVKAENLNPGGSIKDRAALMLLQRAEERGQLKPHAGHCVVEGTGGNTGVALAMLASSCGYQAKFAMPAAISMDKVNLMQLFGAQTFRQPSKPITDPEHYYNVAKRLSQLKNHFGPDQFENTDNGDAHYTWTAPEMWQQAKGQIDGFICASGTGGTMNGCSRFFKQVKPSMPVYLIDPPGSGLFNFVNKGDTTFRASGSSITEGIGITRLTNNFKGALVDKALKGTDEEAVTMVYYLLRNEGLYVGPSAALNVVGAVKMARELGPGHTVATVICDTGDRYLSTVFNQTWLKDKSFDTTAPQRGDLSFVS
eukprot:TRINITY_DN4944_c0_g1_i1.p1 TRINITY_DN4944_c0_g1~~TRINITY_DN4944_c0_g1_i1.p1  ORF type:complete len:366 (+),score=77.31 TRINITY_DN4944_c0_g1_i1:3-1100(+)